MTSRISPRSGGVGVRAGFEFKLLGPLDVVRRLSGADQGGQTAGGSRLVAH